MNTNKPPWGQSNGPESLDDLLQNMNFNFDKVPYYIGIGLIVLLALIGISTSFYTVQPEEEAVVKRFGKVVSVRGPGLHFKLPLGVDRAYRIPTQRVLK